MCVGLGGGLGGGIGPGVNRGRCAAGVRGCRFDGGMQHTLLCLSQPTHPLTPPNTHTHTRTHTTHTQQGDILKKGQAVAYVEQLGTFVEIKAPQAGEVARFRVSEGDAVEFGQIVVELAPFFGGHIIGDSKYA